MSRNPLQNGETWEQYFTRHAILDGRGNMDGFFVPLSVAMIAVETLSPKDEEQWAQMSFNALTSYFKDEDKEEVKSGIKRIKSYLKSIENFEKWLVSNMSALKEYYATIIGSNSLSYIDNPTLTPEGIRVEVNGEYHMIPYEALYNLAELQKQEADKKIKEEKLCTLQFSRQARTNELEDLERLKQRFSVFIVLEEVIKRQKELHVELYEIETAINRLNGVFVGRRVDMGGVASDRKPGDYWKIVNGFHGITPNGIHCNLPGTITEFHDRTITVESPLSVVQDGKTWRGYLRFGIWEAA